MKTMRVATYNIHKGVQGLGPLQRLEVPNLARAVAALDADVVCLQEVRGWHAPSQRRFAHWPRSGQASALAPPGYHVAYHANALTRHGEHGNAVLSRWPIVAQAQHDVSDHGFEQRGLLHVVLAPADTSTASPWPAGAHALHVIVVHLGLIHASRRRQVQALAHYMERAVPPEAALVVAGDFNDWGERLHAPMAELGLHTAVPARVSTFPARWPLLPLDRIYVRGLVVRALWAPHGGQWPRWSDHLPLVAEVAWVP
ncbi:endonuclease/exonuclease/phosphatase family protein [Tepidimonas sp.]|uniref:endonuclease/exonuclease/phosphatase family protein n=1 Tax=Tepidimonas sp. TaxID=2002775 RepID=UPI002FE2E4D7